MVALSSSSGEAVASPVPKDDNGKEDWRLAVVADL